MGRVKEFGVCLQNLDARGFITSARLAEELGFGTFWVPVAFEIPGVSPERMLGEVQTDLMPYFL